MRMPQPEASYEKLFVQLRTYSHQLFEFGVLIKAFNGVWEVISGLLIFFLDGDLSRGRSYLLVRDELLERPHDRIMNYLVHSLENYSRQALTFAAIYILAHGCLNIFLAVQLYRRRYWAYLLTIATMAVFVLYQIHRIGLYHSKMLLALTTLDAIFILLTWHEYASQIRRQRDRRTFET